MQEKNQRLALLFTQYVQNTCNRQELDELLQMVNTTPEDAVRIVCRDHWDKSAGEQGISMAGEKLEQMLASLRLHTPEPALHRVRFLKTTWLRYAAILLLLAGTGAYFFYHNYKEPADTISHVNNQQSDIKPGGNKAVLTLSDGSKIVLDSAANGKLAEQGGTKILKLDAGSLAYQQGKTLSGTEGYNTVSTPKGGQYQIILPDGSKVWLNAASSLSFPTAFNGRERKVTVTGEAYFEIAVNNQQPFYVHVNETDIQVLGTSFNINAYLDEPSMKTTLLNGSIKVVKGNISQLLLPGQQAVVKENIQVDKTIDLEQVMAWKNGSFNFNKLSLEQVMRQLSRWYDIEVIYEKSIPSIQLWGSMGRDLTLSQALEGLKEMDVHYRIEGRRVIIIP